MLRLSEEKLTKGLPVSSQGLPVAWRAITLLPDAPDQAWDSQHLLMPDHAVSLAQTCLWLETQQAS